MRVELKRKSVCFLIPVAFNLQHICIARAQESNEQLKENPERSSKPYRSKGHDEFFVNDSAHTLQVVARNCLRGHNYSRAIPLIERALKLDPDDVELHCLYAQALQEKLEHMEDKDPRLFNKVVKTWLVVMRNEVGMEKGLSYRGISLENGVYGDEEVVLRAKTELRHLTGYVPKMWETDDHYLKRVLKVARTSVTARIREKTSGAAVQDAKP